VRLLSRVWFCSFTVRFVTLSMGLGGFIVLVPFG
jgi:hypothetical protein